MEDDCIWEYGISWEGNWWQNHCTLVVESVVVLAMTWLKTMLMVIHWFHVVHGG